MRAAVVGVVVLVGGLLGACGSGDGSSVSSDLVRLPGGFGGGRERSTAAVSMSAEAGDDADSAAGGSSGIEPAIAPFREVKYELAADVKRLGGTATAYRVDSKVDRDRVEQLARRLDLEGNVEEEYG